MTDDVATTATTDGASALLDLAEDIKIVTEEGAGEVLNAAVLTPADLESYYDAVERVVETQQVANDDATQLLFS